MGEKHSGIRDSVQVNKLHLQEFLELTREHNSFLSACVSCRYKISSQRIHVACMKLFILLKTIFIIFPHGAHNHQVRWQKQVILQKAGLVQERVRCLEITAWNLWVIYTLQSGTVPTTSRVTAYHQIPPFCLLTTDRTRILKPKICLSSRMTGYIWTQSQAGRDS